MERMTIVFFLVYHNETLIGIKRVDVFREYPDTIWIDWPTILLEHRKRGYGEKVLLDITFIVEWSCFVLILN